MKMTLESGRVIRLSEPHQWATYPGMRAGVYLPFVNDREIARTLERAKPYCMQDAAPYRIDLVVPARIRAAHPSDRRGPSASVGLGAAGQEVEVLTSHHWFPLR